jgi:hypothetical protein
MNDRLFFFFALAFFVEAVSRIIMAALAGSSEEHRLSMFCDLFLMGSSYGRSSRKIASVHYKDLKHCGISKFMIGNVTGKSETIRFNTAA